MKVLILYKWTSTATSYTSHWIVILDGLLWMQYFDIKDSSNHFFFLSSHTLKVSPSGLLVVKACINIIYGQKLVDRDSYLVRTMETASLRMLSPNTSMLRTGSTLRALNMAIVATGSTAEMREPKAKLQDHRRNGKIRRKLLSNDTFTSMNSFEILTFGHQRKKLMINQTEILSVDVHEMPCFNKAVRKR